MTIIGINQLAPSAEDECLDLLDQGISLLHGTIEARQ